MKKLLVFLVAAIVALPAFSGTDWIETINGKIDCRKISLRSDKANVVLEDGQKVGIHFKDIQSFSRNGRVFVKLRLYEENKPTDKQAFMEQIGTWNNLNLMKLKVRDMDAGITTESSRYFLYNGSKFYLELDNRTLLNTCKAFGLTLADL